MNIMGMGWQEMMIILVGALLIFGPDRLPEVAGQIGKFIKDLRKMTGELTGELERNAGVGDIKKAVQGELAGIKGSLEGATSGVNKTVSGASSSVKSSVTSATNAAKSATAAKSTSTSVSSASAPKTTAKAVTTTSSTTKAAPAPKPVASKKDPLADVSFFEDVVTTKQAASATNGVKITTLPASSAETTVAAQPAVASPAQLDALGRARQRRQAAGYNRISS